jgi:hypothetical protein
MDEQQLQERIHSNRSFQTLAGVWVGVTRGYYFIS